MTRRDFRTFAWLTALAIWLSLWWVLRANPCLDNALRDRWSEWSPAPTANNLYGIVACDYWPETRDHVITMTTLLLIAWLIGHLAARYFDHRPVRRAGMIMLAGMVVALGLSNFAFLPGLLRDAAFIGNGPAMTQVGMSLLSILLGVLPTLAAAWATLRTRARG